MSRLAERLTENPGCLPPLLGKLILLIARPKTQSSEETQTNERNPETFGYIHDFEPAFWGDEGRVGLEKCIVLYRKTFQAEREIFDEVLRVDDRLLYEELNIKIDKLLFDCRFKDALDLIHRTMDEIEGTQRGKYLFALLSGLRANVYLKIADTFEDGEAKKYWQRLAITSYIWADTLDLFSSIELIGIPLQIIQILEDMGETELVEQMKE